MMDTKVIKTEEQYLDYLAEIQNLIAAHPSSGTKESDRLELLSVLIEAYENNKYPIEAPDPVDAIQFRMHEQGLKQADLIPYFGTRSRVSEVLARKRPLTVQMIRALAIGLGLSTETLIGLSDTKPIGTNESADWSKFPIKEIITRGWLNKFNNNPLKSTEEVVKDFITEMGLEFGALSFRRTIGGEAYSPNTKYALFAWAARVIQKSRERRHSLSTFDQSIFSTTFLRELAQLSWFDHGPLLAVEFLAKHGIAVIIEPHLKGTLLDGAALKDKDGTAIIGLTLRTDRLDNFWFTLLHEVAHLWKHVGNTEMFLDDLDASTEDVREIEANRIARESFIPRSVWKRSEAYLSPSRDTVYKLAKELKIHPSIIAGRIHKERNNYQLFADVVGYGEVKKLFVDFN